MKLLKTFAASCLIILALGTQAGWCQRPSITIDVSHPGAKISPTLYGIFFEEINHAGDGGLYAELIRNRSLEEQTTLGWSLESSGTAQARMALDTSKPLNNSNRTSLRVEVVRADKSASVAVVNEGYWGIALQRGEKYNLSFYARATGLGVALEARLQGPEGKVFAAQSITGIGPEWKRYAASFESSGAEPKARLALVASAPGTIWLDTVSLFPAKTFKGRPNGMRQDVAQMLADLKPAFMRFPGGCYVEGGDYLRNAFRWKTTVTDNAERPGHLNDTWGYYSTDGLGYHEYLQLSEDLGAEPLFTVNVGMSHREAEPLERMNTWVQDALDAIEYANGPVTSKWGALRAKNGHPAPFNLKYVEIGNENGGPNYEARYPLFYNAIKAKYPNITLIANTLVKSPMDIVDNHIYSSPDRMRSVTNTYDSWDRAGRPKVFVGEYANNSGVGAGNLNGALAEAAYMIGFERNADVVIMASYAPLFYHVEDRRWPVNLIGYDSAHVFGTPSYWVQWLFAHNRGDVVLPLSLQVEKEKVVIPADRGGVSLGTMNSQAEFKDVRVSSGSRALYSSDFANGASEWRTMGGTWSAENGVYRQTASDARARASIGGDDWQDYSVTLKVRKTAGDGPVSISVRSRGPGAGVTLSLGGPAGTLASLDRMAMGMARGGQNSLGTAPGALETGRWYDVRIDVTGPRAQVFIDGKPAIDVANFYRELTLSPMEAAASLSESSGEIIVKVVNFSEQARSASIQLEGAPRIQSEGTEIVLTSASLQDENSIEQPRKVAPVTRNASGFSSDFTRTFAPRSLTILRLKTVKTAASVRP
jgi:alpha-L-arabinofuranosidase